MKKVQQTLGASVSFLNAANAKSGNSFDVGSLLAILECALAITCFVIAAIPATSVPWRPVAIFMSQRQVDFTVAGCALLLGAAFMFLFMKAS